MDLNKIIISEIKKDRERLLKAISDSHIYDFEDVSEETPIVLSNCYEANLEYKSIESLKKDDYLLYEYCLFIFVYIIDQSFCDDDLLKLSKVIRMYFNKDKVPEYYGQI